MVLPTDVIYPLTSEITTIDQFPNLAGYVRNLVETLTERDREIVDVVNGTIKLFTPIVQGTTAVGVGTYTTQDGWVLRQGLMTDVWFFVEWTAHTGTGVMTIQLPYKCANSTSFPFNGLAATGTLLLSPGYTSSFCVCGPNTFSLVLGQMGSGVPITTIPMQANGRIQGHIRYIGKEIES